MNQLFDRLDAGNVIMLVVMLIGLAAMAWLVRDARRECERQQRRAEEAEMWLLLADEEVAVLRQRLAAQMRRNRSLQQMYAALVQESVSLCGINLLSSTGR